MKLSYLPYDLQFRHPFGVSSNIRTHTPVVYVSVCIDGIEGYGEASLPPYLGETRESTIQFMKRAEMVLGGYNGSFELNEVLFRIDRIDEGHNAAKAALDIAMHDLAGKLQEKPLYELLGLQLEQKHTSHTIGIGDEKLLAQKINEAHDFPVLKIKLGGGNDKLMIDEIRKHTDKPLYVDVNQGWTDEKFVLDMIGWLASRNVVLVEQPMPVNMIGAMIRIKSQSELPLIADESVKRLNDIEMISEGFHGVNIKLMKSTGVREAKLMAEKCKELGLKVYLGCMGESTCASAAMAHIMQYADYVDLDAPRLITNDMFCGLKYIDGKVILRNVPGTGANTAMNI